jgi:hypothetical protein
MIGLQARGVILELDMVTNKYFFIRTLQSAHIRTNTQVNRFVPMVNHLFWQYRKRLRLGPDTWRNFCMIPDASTLFFLIQAENGLDLSCYTRSSPYSPSVFAKGVKTFLSFS